MSKTVLKKFVFVSADLSPEILGLREGNIIITNASISANLTLDCIKKLVDSVMSHQIIKNDSISDCISQM